MGNDQLLTREIDPEAEPGLTEQLLYVQGIRSQPWRALSITEALTIPAVFRANHLVASLVASIPLRSYQDGALIDSPRLIARPDPFTPRRRFYYGVGWHLASRGESILYAAAVEADRRQALTILNLPLREVEVEWADDRQLEKRYSWRGRPLDSWRVKHLAFVMEPGELRGKGPLQIVGAALGAAAEADEWAARYFGEGGLTAVHLHSETKLLDEEAEAIRKRWIDTKSAVRVTSGGVMTASPLGTPPAEAQLIEARLHNRGEVAVMYGMPGKLLEYGAPGSSLTYENVGDLMTEFARTTLSPTYLTEIEEAMTDYLPRAMTTRFDLDDLQRADIKTRYDVHSIAIETGIYDAAHAAREEGITPGDPDRAPVPAAGPEPGGIPSAQAAGVARVR
jgi:HK97 family phage portal protein